MSELREAPMTARERLRNMADAFVRAYDAQDSFGAYIGLREAVVEVEGTLTLPRAVAAERQALLAENERLRAALDAAKADLERYLWDDAGGDDATLISVLDALRAALAGATE